MGECEAGCRIGLCVIVSLVVATPSPSRAQETATITCAPTCVVDRDVAAGTQIKLKLTVGGTSKTLGVSLGRQGDTVVCADGECTIKWPGADKLSVVVEGKSLRTIVKPAEDLAGSDGRRRLTLPALTRGEGNPFLDPREAMVGDEVVDVPSRMPQISNQRGPLPEISQRRPREAPAGAQDGSALVSIPEIPEAPRAPVTAKAAKDALDIFLEDVVMVSGGCSGVVVAPNAVLTARHCASARHLGVERPGRRVDAIEVVRNAVPRDPALDVALLWTDRALGVPIRPIGYGLDPSKLGIVRLAGYGANTRTGRSGYGRKRQAVVAVNGWHCDSRVAARTGCRVAREAVLVAAGADTCNGDSGGPVLVRHEDRWKLTAITSRAVPGRGLPCGRGGIYTPVDAFAGWLEAALAGGEG